MKSKTLALMLMFLAISCDEPETIVTNYVRPDGSVTRKIEMRNVKNMFDAIQVPFDSSWVVRDSVEVNDKGDTVWIKRAEKTFRNAEEINLSYSNDKGINRNSSRHVRFEKKFRWFNTTYRFSEIVNCEVQDGYPITGFLNEEELGYFYSPQSLRDELRSGPDSIRYSALDDTINKKTDKYAYSNILVESLARFEDHIKSEKEYDTIKKSLDEHRDYLIESFELAGDDADSLWKNGILLRNVIGEKFAAQYQEELSSALDSVGVELILGFSDYSVRTVMPGRITGTNGFADAGSSLIWPVSADYFLAQDYEMWAESKVINLWACIVSGLFVVFVITGISLRKKAE